MKRIGMTISAAAMTTAGVHAGTLTSVEPPKWAGEATHGEIFSEVFGGNFEQTGNDYSNGSLDITRVHDDQDQTYSFEQWSATALYSDAAFSQAFGTTAGGKLFDAVGSRGPVTGSVLNQAGGDDIAFSRFSSGSSTMGFSTDPNQNPDGLDQVVTYRYVNEQQQTAYLLFFEDIKITGGDRDYNDLVVELTGSQASPSDSIPEPSSLALLAIGGLSMLRRRRDPAR